MCFREGEALEKSEGGGIDSRYDDVLGIAFEHADENSDSVVNVTEVFLLFGKLALFSQSPNLTNITITPFFLVSLPNLTFFRIIILFYE